MPRDNERVQTPGGLAKVVNVDYFNGKINTRAIEKDPETGEEVFAQEIIPYTKEEIRRIGKNAKKKHDGDAFDQALDNDEVPSGDVEEIEELEKLMRDF